jgi:hypothetical protein
MLDLSSRPLAGRKGFVIGIATAYLATDHARLITGCTH